MRLAFCDTETTGFYVNAGHEAWEVAVIVVDGDDTIERSWQLPVDVSKADPQSLAMNGWYQRSLQQQRGLETGQLERETEEGFPFVQLGLPKGITALDQFAREFMDLVHGATLIGAVPSFDERFVTQALHKGGGVPCWHYQPVDVETLAVGWILGQAEQIGVGYLSETLTQEQQLVVAGAAPLLTPPWDSETISNVIGVNPDLYERHSALGDCWWAKAIWDLIMTPPVSDTNKGE